MSSGRWGLSQLVILAAVFCSGPAAAAEWTSLFDGKELGRWQVLDKYDFINHGKVEVKDGQIVLGVGRPGTGVRLTGEFPKLDYEVSLEAMRVEGDDFFCCLSFPVGESALSLVVGGWGGTVVGLSMIDGEPAVENVTVSFKEFKLAKWYTIRLRVTRLKVEAWIDKEQVVDFQTEGHKLSLYFEEESALPLAVATWRTTGAIRNVRVRRLDTEEVKPAAAEAGKEPPPAGSTEPAAGGGTPAATGDRPQ
jgi:hypothetical protein